MSTINGVKSILAYPFSVHPLPWQQLGIIVIKCTKTVRNKMCRPMMGKQTRRVMMAKFVAYHFSEVILRFA